MNTNLNIDLMDDYLVSKKKIEAVLALPRITKEDLESLTEMETDYLHEQINQTYYSLEGEEREIFTRKIGPLLSGRSNKEAWEHNHTQITGAIEKLMCEAGFMPSNTAIARETGLSRQTIIKHMNDYHSHGYAADMERLKAKVPELLSKIHACALKGNMEAARLYFQVTGALPVGGAAV